VHGGARGLPNRPDAGSRCVRGVRGALVRLWGMLLSSCIVPTQRPQGCKPVPLGWFSRPVPSAASSCATRQDTTLAPLCVCACVDVNGNWGNWPDWDGPRHGNDHLRVAQDGTDLQHCAAVCPTGARRERGSFGACAHRTSTWTWWTRDRPRTSAN